MPVNAALFLFLAAAVVAVFTFCSIFVWVSGPSRERLARDRLALLKTIAENPSDQAIAVLELLREEDRIRIERRAREERRGWIVAGGIVMAVGVALAVISAILGDRGAWTVSLIPFLVGGVLLGAGLLMNRGAAKSRKEIR